jgi:Fe-S cluster biogenesis protein NfuA
VEKISISVLPTPNPNALKFVLDRSVKTDGNSYYRSPLESKDNPLACYLFAVRGVDQLHFFQNVITITKFSYEDWEAIEPKVRGVLSEKISEHNPDYFDPDPEEERRKKLSPELLEIEDILDKTIRPGLQGDGGDLVCLSFEDDILVVKYQGACGTCPSATTGTLEAIKAILRDELNNPDIDVYIAPEF